MIERRADHGLLVAVLGGAHGDGREIARELLRINGLVAILDTENNDVVVDLAASKRTYEEDYVIKPQYIRYYFPRFGSSRRIGNRESLPISLWSLRTTGNQNLQLHRCTAWHSHKRHRSNF